MSLEILRPYLDSAQPEITVLSLPIQEHAITAYGLELKVALGLMSVAQYRQETYPISVQIQSGCTPIEDQQFAVYVQRLDALVAQVYPQVNQLNSGSHDSRPAANTWRAAYDQYNSKDSWCLTTNNPNLPTFRRLENDLSTLAQRIVAVMKSNFRSYLGRITPLINNGLRECKTIGSSSYDGSFVVESIKQIVNSEEEFYFGLVDDDISRDINQLNLLYASLNSEVQRCVNQLYNNCSETLTQVESYASDGLASFALIDHPDRDGLEQFTEGEQKFAFYYAKTKDVDRFKLIDDGSGRIETLVLHQFHCDFSLNLGESSFPN